MRPQSAWSPLTDKESARGLQSIKVLYKAQKYSINYFFCQYSLKNRQYPFSLLKSLVGIHYDVFYMLKSIDKFLNSITMYKLVLYGLLLLAAISIVLGFVGVLPQSGLSLLLSLVVLVITCYVSNEILGRLYKAPRNSESYFITALILFFILSPLLNVDGLPVFLYAGVLAMASKYIFAIHKRHIFNPVAIAVFILGLLGSGDAIWWIGSGVLAPITAILGLLIVRKIRRFSLFTSFLLTSLVFIVAFGLKNGLEFWSVFTEAFTSWPLVFFASIMLTEPLTTPSTRKWQVVYGALVGALFGSQFHIGPIFSTPELSLVLGNIFSYIVGSKQKLMLKLKEKKMIVPGIYEFVFRPDQKLEFAPGQYLEWTLPHAKADSRGNRRYFTIASSPTEDEIKLGVRINEKESSSFKKALLQMHSGDGMVASQLSGDFTMPQDPKKKLVFIAGGIGITPFRSMIKYLIDKNEKRDVTLFYSTLDPNTCAYNPLFEEAVQKIGLKNICVISDTTKVPSGWTRESGYITADMIQKRIPNFAEHVFYLSGPNAMVENYKKLLLGMKVPKKNIETDYFPGF